MDSIHLSGADDVRSAGHSMRGAAEQISSAAMTIDSAACMIRQALDQHQAFLEDWLRRFELIVTNSPPDPVAEQVLKLQRQGITDANGN
jgi:orotate phosphoribosyltransferase